MTELLASAGSSDEGAAKTARANGALRAHGGCGFPQLPKTFRAMLRKILILDGGFAD
jgi:hypothetical protein